MKYYELDKDEKEILDAVEKGDFKPISGAIKEIERLRSFARASLNREKNIRTYLNNNV